MSFKERPLPIWLSAPLSLWAWFTAVFFSVFYSTMGFIFVLPFSILLDHGTRRMTHGVSVMWARSIMATSPIWKLKVEGAEHVKEGKAYVVVANHQSMLDILVALSGLPFSLHFKFIAKKELFPIPFMGWHMSCGGYIPLDRSSRESGRKVLLHAGRLLDQGVSVLFFPEGTRSLDGKIQKFKLGAFKLAQDHHVEVLPLVIAGTGSAVPKHSWKVNKTTQFILSIGKPVSLKADSNVPIEKLCEPIHTEMAVRLEALKKQ